MNSPREDWLALRRTGVGGSDIGAIVGVSKFRSALDVWLDKTGRAEPQAETLPMRVGSFTEQLVAELYTERTGRRVQRYNATLRHPKLAFALANLDRLVIPEGAKVAAHRSEIRTDTLLECKTAGAFSAKEWGNEDDPEAQLPLAYTAQVHWYMGVADLPCADLAVLIGNSDFRVYRINRDEELIAWLFERAERFWVDNVQGDTPPAPTTPEEARTLWPQASGRAVTLADDFVSLSLRRASLAEQIKALEGEVDEIKTAFMSRMQDAEVAYDAVGDQLATWKSGSPKTSTDWEQVARAAMTSIPNASRAALIGAHTSTKQASRRFLFK
jgi:putative phage-type endonuclease